MPRRTKTPLLEPIRAHYVFMTKRAIKEQKALDEKARERRAKLKRRLELKADRDEFTLARLNRDIDKIQSRPSKLAVKQLRDMVRSPQTPAQIRVRASAILTQWALGDFSYGRRRRRQEA